VLKIRQCSAHSTTAPTSAQVPHSDALRPSFNVSLQPCSNAVSTHPSPHDRC
jgi:hypothetical protein